jgi:transposase
MFDENKLPAGLRREHRTRPGAWAISGCLTVMSDPGIGALSVLADVSTIEDPGASHDLELGAHLGLTPSHYQSGEIDHSGRISKCGNRINWSRMIYGLTALQGIDTLIQ